MNALVHFRGPRFAIVAAVAALALASAASAQSPYIRNENGRRVITPWQRAFQPSPALESKGGYYWAAFSEAPSSATREALSSLGAEVLGFAGRSDGAWLYKVRIQAGRPDVHSYLRGRAGFLNLEPILPQDKLAARYYGLRKSAAAAGRSLPKEKATLYFHRPMEWNRVQTLLAGKVSHVEYDPEPRMVHVEGDAGSIRALGDLEDVWRVGPYAPRFPTNDRARTVTGVAELQGAFLDTVSFPPTPEWNRGLPHTGEGIRICVNEGIDSNHMDFRESLGGGLHVLRRGPVETWTSSYHGTHVAAIAAGNGWNSEAAGGRPYQFRGVAPKAVILPYWEGGDVNNHSFTNGFESYYNYADAGVDERFSNHNGILADANNAAVWAAGNNGGSKPQYGNQRGYYSMLVNAKNPLKVAASDASGSLRSAFSSMGPTRDGRLGPDVTAPGESIRSAAEAGQGYAVMSGTSMACPHVTGIVALLLQKYQDDILRPQGILDIHNNPPWNSTLKAILIHTARDMVDLAGTQPSDANPDFAAAGFPDQGALYGPGPDFATGYGMVDAKRAVEYMDPRHLVESSVDNGQTRSYTLRVGEGLEGLRVSVAWDDPPFLGVNDEAGAYSRKLVNNLDVRLVSPTGQVHQPWVLDVSPLNDGKVPANGLDPVTPDDIRGNPARKGKDDANNVEVVDVAFPESGDWTVEVRGFEVPVDQSLDAGVNQDFSLVSDLPAEYPQPAPAPDLVVTGISWTPEQPSPADKLRFRATVRNIGAVATPSGTVHGVTFYVAGSAVARSEARTASLQPGEEFTVEGDIGVDGGDGTWQAYSGLVPVSAAVDVSDLIPESRENDNARLQLVDIPKFPRPWVMNDVGAVAFPGFGYFFDNTFYVTGEGDDFFGAADAGNFVHQEADGPTEITARINWVDDTHPWAKAGLMFREDLTPGARNVMIAATSKNGIAFQYRTEAGGTSIHVGVDGATPVLLRLRRDGDVFTGYVSEDGSAWKVAGTVTLPMSRKLRVGMAVCSRMPGTSTTGSFGEVKVEPLLDPAPPSKPAPSLPKGWSNGDAGAVGVAGNFEYAGGVHTVRGSGADIWGNVDGFHFAGAFLPGDGEIVARVTGIQAANSWAKAGVMIRESLEPGARHAFMALTVGNGGAFQRRAITNRESAHTPAGAAKAPYWVKLSRSGDMFRGWYSADGKEWTLAGQERIAMYGELRVGLAVTSHDNGALCKATFDNMEIRNQEDWTLTDVGQVGQAGSHNAANGVFAVYGSGSDIWDRADSYSYLHKTLDGDGEIQARIIGLDNTHAWAKAGLMIRESAAPGSRHAMISLTPQHGIEFLQRTETDGLSKATAYSGAAPVWLRLVRAGKVITAYRSKDGKAWTTLGSATVDLPAKALIGLAALSHDNQRLTMATFTGVDIIE